jgi:hypothetical protein
MHVASLADLKFSDVKMKYSHLQRGEFARWATKAPTGWQADYCNTRGSDLDLKHIPPRPCSALSCRK